MSTSSLLIVVVLLLQRQGIWKEYPVAMTAYTYLFGSIFMGVATLYYVFTGQAHLFVIPRHVSTCQLLSSYRCTLWLYNKLYWLYSYLINPLLEHHINPLQSLLALVYAVFVTSAFCYSLLAYANKYLPSSAVTAFWPVQVCNRHACFFGEEGKQINVCGNFFCLSIFT